MTLVYPVSTVRRYLSRRRKFCPDCSNFYISTGQVKKKPNRDIVALWIISAINEAYKMASEGDYQKVYGVGFLLDFKRFSILQFMQTGTWLSQTTFTAYYFRDVTHRSRDTFSIGRVVAAQQVM